MYSLYFDGGSRGNPGIGGSGAVIYEKDGSVLVEGILPISGNNTTNNVAEYKGLILGLELCVENEITDISVYGDSKLVIEQMSGKWKVKNETIASLVKTAKSLASKVNVLSYNHIPREKNKHADKLSNIAMDIVESETV